EQGVPEKLGVERGGLWGGLEVFFGQSGTGEMHKIGPPIGRLGADHRAGANLFQLPPLRVDPGRGVAGVDSRGSGRLLAGTMGGDEGQEQSRSQNAQAQPLPSQHDVLLYDLILPEKSSPRNATHDYIVKASARARRVPGGTGR